MLFQVCFAAVRAFWFPGKSQILQRNLYLGMIWGLARARKMAQKVFKIAQGPM